MHVLSNVLFIHSINPYWINSVVPGGWSIGVEMLFYCMVPYLFEKIKNSSQALNFIVICLFLRAALEAFLKLSPTIRANRLYNEFFFLSLPSQLPVFGAGILLFFIIKEGYSISSTGRSVAIIACMILLNYVSGNNIFLPTYLMFGFGFLLLALALSKTPFPILVNPLFTFMGKISYSMYLSHFALLYWMEKNGLGDFINVTGVTSALANYCIRLLVLLLATMSVSWLMYKLIELPAQKMARRIIRKISQQNQSQLVIHSNEI
jgi:peptidoglycan/LPS O-acetylase OafA/YrhL